MIDDQKERLLKELRQTAQDLMNSIARAQEKLNEIQGLLNSSNAVQQPVRVAPSSTSPLQSSIHRRLPSAPIPSPSPPSMDRPEKLRTGIEKLDDLLSGGIRLSSNVLLVGPPYSGKDTLAWNFVGQSLREKIPVAVITTDKSINDLKMEISKIYPDVNAAEASGYIKFIDVYSKSIQSQTQSQYAVTIDTVINVSSLLKAMDTIVSQFANIAPFYRLVFTSLTTYVSEIDEKVLMKFVQQFAQKRKSDGGTSLYLIESGLFDKKVIEALSYHMDGSITFRTDASKLFLRVEGLGSVRSRDWVEVFPSENTFELGAFTLEKIR